MGKALIFLLGIIFTSGCSSMREDPDDSFAPRPENAKSESYMIVRIGEERSSPGIRKYFLLDMIKRYREEYTKIKSSSDFGTGHYDEIHYKEYLRKVQAFKDSDLDAAEEYIKSLPDSLRFICEGPDEGKYDIGDINWSSKSRKLRIADFYSQRYTDDWSPYAFVINMIPTARDGFGKFEFELNGEKLFFRKPVRKKIWTFSSGYFWVAIDYYTFENSNGEAPALLSISDSNDSREMKGLYLIMPRKGIFGDTAAVKSIREAEEKAKQEPNYIPPEKLDYGAYAYINEDTIDGAEYVYEKRSSGVDDKVVYTYLSHKSELGRKMNVRVVLDTYRRDPELFRKRIEEVRLRVPKTEVEIKTNTDKISKVDSGPWSIINKETLPLADIIQHELGRRKTAEQVLEYFRKNIKSVYDEGVVKELIKLCLEDRTKFKSLLLPFRKK